MSREQVNETSALWREVRRDGQERARQRMRTSLEMLAAIEARGFIRFEVLNTHAQRGVRGVLAALGIDAKDAIGGGGA